MKSLKTFLNLAERIGCVTRKLSHIYEVENGVDSLDNARGYLATRKRKTNDKPEKDPAHILVLLA
jgi:hypothetical protein